ncbi:MULTISPECIES: hypothetical protein [unclassified Mycolicibacterium]|uniref:hypothetical protein n=1 Tax=unclassified Mycolicibacterium TaxID=2636767 RepID=UPI0013911B2D|nr:MULTISPECIES: hypothetical protein [unclassified Mycolicibacterium]
MSWGRERQVSLLNLRGNSSFEMASDGKIAISMSGRSAVTPTPDFWLPVVLDGLDV